MKIIRLEQKDRRLGRHIVHDPKSKDHPMRLVGVDRSTWKTKYLPIYDPVPNPNQELGNCTTCAKAMQMNAAGNRKPGVRLDMKWAEDAYRIETHLDEFRGAWEPDDTGSSGLASCKTAIKMGVGGTYKWFFGGGDEVIQYLMEETAHPVSVGTVWLDSMFDQDAKGFIHATGKEAGGHQWIVRGYNKSYDAIRGRCWWGPEFRDFYLARSAFNELLGNDGDAHVQERVQ